MRRDAVFAQGPRSDHELDPEALMPFGTPGRGFWLESAKKKVGSWRRRCGRHFSASSLKRVEMKNWVTAPPLNSTGDGTSPSSTSPLGKMRLVASSVGSGAEQMRWPASFIMRISVPL